MRIPRAVVRAVRKVSKTLATTRTAPRGSPTAAAINAGRAVSGRDKAKKPLTSPVSPKP